MLRNKPRTKRISDPHARSQNWATWVAAVAAALAVPVSLYSLYQSHEAQLSATREDVMLRVSPYHGDYPVTFKDWLPAIADDSLEDGRGPDFGGVAGTLWSVLIANNGASPVSLVSYQVQVADDRHAVYYSGLDQGLVDSQLRPMNLPVNLAPGTSQQCFVRIGAGVARHALKYVREIFSSNATVSQDVLSKGLALHETDIYGNRVKPMMDGAKVVGWSLETSAPAEQRFVVVFRSARGIPFSDASSYYEFSKDR